MKKAFIIFIGFLHDFAAGCWGATVLAVYWVDLEAAQRQDLKPLLDGLERRFFWGVSPVSHLCCSREWGERSPMP